MGIQAMPPRFADVNGDGSLDAALILLPDPQSPERNFDLKIFSLRDGAILWSRALRQSRHGMDFPQVEISKVPADGSSVVYVTEEPETQTTQEFLAQALDGRNGSLRWTWRCVERDGNHTASCGIDPIALNGQGKDSICVTCNDESGETRIVILDPQGREVARRTLPRASHSRNDNATVSDLMMDLDGDGRDELAVWYDRRLRAWGRDLKEHWSRPRKAGRSRDSCRHHMEVPAPWCSLLPPPLTE